MEVEIFRRQARREKRNHTRMKQARTMIRDVPLTSKFLSASFGGSRKKAGQSRYALASRYTEVPKTV